MRPSWTHFVIGVCLVLSACGDKAETVHTGYVEADWRYVSPTSAGRIVSQHVEKGDRVEAGELLFELDSEAERLALDQANAQAARAGFEVENLGTGARAPEIAALQANLAQAKTRLVKAKSDYERYANLKDSGAVSEKDYDAALAELNASDAAVKAASQQIEVARLPGRPAQKSAAEAGAASALAAQQTAAYRLTERQVMSPVAGRVEEVFFRVGEIASPERPVLAILPDDALKVRFFVPEDDVTGLEIGDSVAVSADGVAAVSATISFVAHEAEYTPPVIYSRDQRDRLVFLVEAKLPVNGQLHPGLPVDVDWK